MSDPLSLDLETRSTVDLKKAGAHVYFESPTTEILVGCYALGDAPVRTWWPGDPCPALIEDHVLSGGPIAGWNVGFEMLGWNALLGPRHGWPVPAPEQYDDTMAMAAAMALPRALGQAAHVLGVEEQKDDEGYRLMMRMTKPRRVRKGEVPGRVYWNEEPEQLERLAAYCRRDVETERAVRRLLVPLSDAERAVWLLDLKMNNRGVKLDVPLINALSRVIEQAKGDLDEQMAEVTGGAVTACSQVAALTVWLRERGVDATSLAKNAIEDLLAAPDLPWEAKTAIEIRKLAAKTSTAKLSAMKACMCADERARGLHLYHGAGTGRWAGKLIQTQNMPRGTGTVKDPEVARPYFVRGSAESIEFLYGSPMNAASDMLRSCLIASPGHRLVAADYSSIEGRVTAWLAGEEDEIEAYRAVDAGTGAGIYEIAAADIFNVTPKAVSKAQRQVGKVATLALGFAGGVMAFHNMANIYAVDMAPVYPILRDVVSDDLWDAACDRYDECLKRNDTGTDVLTREAWIASEITKVRWRLKHPRTVALWQGLQDAAFEAVSRPGSVASYGRIDYVVRRGFLWCRLPSKRCLAYGAPKIRDWPTPWGDRKPAVTAMGVNSTTKKWERFALYGGLATENAVQATARDLMAEGMLRVEAAGYPVVMTVHDEAVSDTPLGHGTLAEYERLLCTLPAWAEGLPVTASGYEAFAYKKD